MRPSPVFALALAAVLVTGCGSGQTASRGVTTAGATSLPDRTISAVGTGKAEASPDVLTITIGVQTQAERAVSALADNNGRAAAVIAKLKAGGVADRDVQTTNLSISPTYSAGAQVITGYQVSDFVTAKLRKLDRAGALIDDAASAAGDAARIQSITFSIDDDSALLTQARAAAVRQATAHIKAMADAAGATLGKLRSISDTSVEPQPFNAGAALAAPASGAVPIEPGTQQLSVAVTVVYDLAS